MGAQFSQANGKQLSLGCILTLHKGLFLKEWVLDVGGVLFLVKHTENITMKL